MDSQTLDIHKIVNIGTSYADFEMDSFHLQDSYMYQMLHFLVVIHSLVLPQFFLLLIFVMYFTNCME